jgi:hypothetical protein
MCFTNSDIALVQRARQKRSAYRINVAVIAMMTTVGKPMFAYVGSYAFRAVLALDMAT